MNRLRTTTRRLGLGRLLFRWVHRPRALARDYGWRLVWRAARGEARMKRAARRLPPPPPDRAEQIDATLCFLTGERFLHQTLFCAHSWAAHAHVGVPIEFISDGSLAPGHVRALQRLFPGAKVRLPDELDRAVAAALPPEKFPALHAVRKKFVLLRKLTDAMAGRRGYRLFLDSDMRFWAKPDELLARCRSATPLYMADTVADGYTAGAVRKSKAGSARRWPRASTPA
jgi:hypothetical protein